MAISYQDNLNQATFGLQRPLILTSWPATLNVKSADYPRLIDQTALPDGTYYCRVDIGGTSALNLQLTAAFAAGTVTSDANTCYFLPNNNISDAQANAAPYRYQAFTGIGALATATRQTATIAVVGGEQFAVVKIVVAGGSAPTFSQAEINGPR